MPGTAVFMTGNDDGDVFGYYTIPASTSGCSYTIWASQAIPSAMSSSRYATRRLI